MIIFNTTLHVDDAVHDECINYLKDVYIPRSLSNNYLNNPALYRIESQHEESGVSYALQFQVVDTDVLDHWIEEVGKAAQQDMALRFGNKVSGFATLLEEIPLSISKK